MCLEEFVTVVCPSCGAKFALDKSHHSALQKCHNGFYCPNGHLQYFPQKSAEDILADKVKSLDEALRLANDRARFAQRSASALRGVITKKNKAGAL